MARPDLPRSKTPDGDKTAATGESEAEAARPVRFKTRPEAGPDKSGHGPENELEDAGELAEKKRPSKPAQKAAPGAMPPDELTTENDDGAA